MSSTPQKIGSSKDNIKPLDLLVAQRNSFQVWVKPTIAVFSGFPNSSAFRFGSLQISECVSRENPSAPHEIKLRTPRGKHLICCCRLWMTLEKKGKVATKDQFLSSIKAKRSPPHEKRGILRKNLYQIPVARRKYALEPSSSTIPNPIGFPALEIRKSRKEGKFLTTSLPQGRKRKASS